MVRVKFCGITNWQDAKAACDLGADALGFNFYEKSVRNISPADAWAIRKKLPVFVAVVGVFVNWTPQAVNSLARSLHLSAAQLHGDESPKNVAATRVLAIKALRVGPKFKLAELRRYQCQAFLLDADKSGEYGGTGVRADWSMAAQAAKSHTVILAGGLTPENVAEAIQIVRPYAVDVASGVELKPGKKDLGRMREFFSEVRRASSQL
jgi:phosphoribosylanthranilate isomerase